ncbi:MFS transporter [Mucilaginibacter sp.]|uniref:MFS transporter n=1 Tax=Mucilaginibacter sp. TaxID=1882438 RepID=UPI0035BC82F6
MATVALNSKAGKWIMVSSIMASAMAFIDGTALNVVLPSLQKNLNASGTDLFWILNAYLLILAAIILVGGSLGDKLGRKKVFMAGIFVFICGSAACGFSPNVPFLIAFRVLQGFGGALMIPGSLSLISSAITQKERGKAIGTWSAFTTIVTMGGPILGGAFADAGLWRYIFFINIPIGITALIFLWRFVAESRDESVDQSIDVWGAVAIALGLACLTFGFLRAPEVGFVNWQVYAPLLGGVMLLICFVVIEKRSRYPMMPLQLFKNATFSGANLLTFFLYAGLGAGMLFMGLNLVQVQGYTQLQSGLTFLPFTILMMSVARFAGAIADKHGPKLLLVTGPAVTGAGLLILSFIKQTPGPSAYWVTFFPGIIVFGLGMSFTVAPLTAAVMGSVDEHLSGAASGVNNALTRIANVFANAVIGALAVLFFSGQLQNQVTPMKLDPQAQQSVLNQAVNLGDAKVPLIVKSSDKEKVGEAFHTSFISAYGKVMKIASGLAFIASLMALIFIKNPPKSDSS